MFSEDPDDVDDIVDEDTVEFPSFSPTQSEY